MREKLSSMSKNLWTEHFWIQLTNNKFPVRQSFADRSDKLQNSLKNTINRNLRGLGWGWMGIVNKIFLKSRAFIRRGLLLEGLQKRSLARRQNFMENWMTKKYLQLSHTIQCNPHPKILRKKFILNYKQLHCHYIKTFWGDLY